MQASVLAVVVFRFDWAEEAAKAAARVHATRLSTDSDEEADELLVAEVGSWHHEP